MNYKWIEIIIVCLIYSILIQPIDRLLKKRIAKRGYVTLIEFIISMVILFALYVICDITGFEAWLASKV